MVGSTDPTHLLARFGLTSFRPGQREVVDAVAAGEDVMCVMPTGGGKSLCYQLPSLARQGTTIVVSPLIALMKDQVDALNQMGIHAKLINSSLTARQQHDVMQEMSAGKLDLVYVAPERLRNSRFLDSLVTANVSLLAVDEAHCVSEWGHDFRPDYSRLGQFREKHLASVQTIALTATATPLVRQDISESLRLKSPRVFVTGFARTNLHFRVAHAKADREKDRLLSDYLKQRDGGAGIIYAATRKRCEELADWLPEQTRRSIGVYHAGLEPAQRQRVQDEFMSGKLSAIVATNAFGMGIDKSDIRFVVHYNIPGSLEAYYQEAGRAGRDGDQSDCLLLFSYNDRYIQEFFIENRYPSKATVEKVYDFLLSREEDPIELTLEQVRDSIDGKDGNEAIGTAETLLAKAGVLRRMDSNANYAMVRIDSDAPTLLDFLPTEAKIRRRVMSAIESVVGKRRGEDVYVKPGRLTELAGVDRDQLTRTLRELKRLRAFDYVPPFRGRAIHFVQRDRSFHDLEIDFEELDRRKAAEVEKLEAVISFARTSSCRQRVILNYFGETGGKNCGTCDRCAPQDGSIGRASDVAVSEPLKGVDSAALLRGIRVVLSGVTRMHGRFGKNLVAQMLCGSKNKKLQQWKLHRLSTYGLLSGLKQTEVVAVMDSLIEVGLLEQKEVDERRPTIHMTPPGRRVMLEEDPLPDAVTMPFPLAKRLASAARNLESGDVQTDSAGQASAEAVEPNENSEQAAAIADRLKRWRRKTAAALAIPAYRVLTNATVERISEACPTTTQQLESISGVGPATIEQFGYDIVELVLAASSGQQVGSSGQQQPDDQPQSEDRNPARPPQENHRSTTDSVAVSAADEMPASPPDPANAAGLDTVSELNSDGDRQGDVPASESRQLPSADTNFRSSDAYWTWRLLHDGYSCHQVAAIRRCDLDQMVEDLIRASAAGRPVEIGWIDDPCGAKKLREATGAAIIGG